MVDAGTDPCLVIVCVIVWYGCVVCCFSCGFGAHAGVAHCALVTWWWALAVTPVWAVAQRKKRRTALWCSQSSKLQHLQAQLWQHP